MQWQVDKDTQRGEKVPDLIIIFAFCLDPDDFEFGGRAIMSVTSCEPCGQI